MRVEELGVALLVVVDSDVIVALLVQGFEFFVRDDLDNLVFVIHMKVLVIQFDIRSKGIAPISRHKQVLRILAGVWSLKLLIPLVTEVGEI